MIILKKFLFFLLLLCLPLSVFADTGHSTVVMEVSSGRVLYSKNFDQPRLIASITKIMTCIIVLENANLEDSVTIGEEVLDMYGTNLYLSVGEKIRVKDLLYGLMLRSGNDAAISLAVHTMGSEEAFVAKMNQKAKEIGMMNTSFENPHGLDEKTQNYSTAYDMALLSQYAYHNASYRKIVQTKKYVTRSSLKSYIWYNRMSLLNQYEYCIGGKNGYTPSAGKTLVSLAKKDGMILTIVSLDDGNIYQNHEELYKKYFNQYSLYTILDPRQFSLESNIVYLKEAFRYPLTKKEINHIQTLLSYHPLQKNHSIGNITIYLEDKIIGKVPLYQKEIIKKENSLSWIQKIKKLLLR